MTDRDAFVLGVTTYCKVAGLDSDDAAEFTGLLFADATRGRAIVKRAAESGGMTKESEPVTMAILGTMLASLGIIAAGKVATTSDETTV